MVIKSFQTLEIIHKIRWGKAYSMDPQGNWYYTGIA